MNDRFLPPWLIQSVGMGLLIAFAIYWAVTGRESTLLVTAAGSLILLGVYERAKETLRKQVERDGGDAP